jgi:hypothetical protein
MPKELYVTPYYMNPAKSAEESRELMEDSWNAYDRRYTNPEFSVSVLRKGSECTKMLNIEAHLKMVVHGSLLLTTYLDLHYTDPKFEEWVYETYATSCFIFSPGNTNMACWSMLGRVLRDVVLHGRSMAGDGVRALLSHITDSDGVMIYEIKRTNSGIWYSYYALAPLFKAASLCGVDPWLFHKPLSWLWKYVQHPQTWPYTPKRGFLGWIQNLLFPHSSGLELPRKDDWPANLFYVAGRVLSNDDWLHWGNPPPYGGVDIFRDGRL